MYFAPLAAFLLMVPLVHILLWKRPGIGVDQRAGPVMLIGGNLDNSNSQVYEELIRLAGGKDGAKIGVITAANERPQYWGNYYMDLLER